MKKIIFLSFILFLTQSCSDKKVNGGIVTPKPPEQKNYSFESAPSWTEDFNYTGAPDPNVFSYETGGSGWGNNELQYYTNKTSNASVENGLLTITARKEAMEGRNYTSARLITKNKKDFLYGRIEVRAKLPAGTGTWPAIWMLPIDWAYGDWPKSGEIDIMEHVGKDLNVVHFTIHTAAYNWTNNSDKSSSKTIATATTDFHIYRMDWTPTSIKGFFDGVQVFTFNNEGTDYTKWPFDKKFHLLLNLAIGGNWGGPTVDDSIFPVSLVVDYVKYYKMIAQ